MATLTNITAGPKGVHTKDGLLVMIEPGASADVDLGDGDFSEEWFSADGGGDSLSSMTVAQLKALAATDEIDLGDATKKSDIIAAIELHREEVANAE